MKTIRTLIFHLTSLILSIILSGCNSAENELLLGYEGHAHTCKMSLSAEYPGFLNDSDTRADNGRWEDGDKVYIHISSAVYGVGTYQNGEWVFSYSGELFNMNNAPCSLYYIKGDYESSDNQLFTMDEKSAIYGTTSGAYSYSAGELAIFATLRPLTSRMRFKGSANTQFVFTPSDALKHYQQLDIAKDQLYAGTGQTSMIVNADGYTDYIYVMAEENVSLSLNVTNTIYSEKQLNKSLFSAGATGYIEIPSSDSFDGWIKKDAPKAILLDGESFNSIIKSLSNVSIRPSTSSLQIL